MKVRKQAWHYLLTLGLSIKARVMLATVISIASVASYFSSVYVLQQHMNQTTTQILQERIEMMHSAAEIKQSLVSYDDALFRFLTIRDSEQLRDRKRLQDTVLADAIHLKDISDSPILDDRLTLLDVESRQYFEDAERLLSYARNNTTLVQDIGRRSQDWVRSTSEEHMELAFLSQEGRARLIRVFALCDEIITVNRLALEQAQKDLRGLMARQKVRALLLGMLTIGVLVLVMAGLVFSVLFPVNELLRGVRQVEQGDLDVQIPTLTSDEMGELTEAFNVTTRTIREQREQLLRESITDHLTGAYNQRHFRKRLGQEVERARRAQSSMALLMIDIDHFKRYNDTHGHEFGNEVIRRIAQQIRLELRQSDIFARYGGDEMIVLLPETNADQARLFAQRLLDDVKGISLPSGVDGSRTSVTISIGGALFPDDGITPEDVLRRADEALYTAKKNGRACAQWSA